MMSDTTVVALRQPDAVEDPLTAVLRSGARRLLAQAVEAEVEACPELAGTAARGRARRSFPFVERLIGDAGELWPKLGDGGLRKAAYRGG